MEERQRYQPKNKNKRAAQIKTRRIIFVAVLIVLILALVFILKGCSNKKSKKAAENTTVPVETTTEDDGISAKATVASVGDILVHQSIMDGAKGEDGKYDFRYNFDLVKSSISSADLAVANFEGSLAESGYSAYPVFKSPDAIIDALKDTGFDFLVTANNHSYDGGFDGMKRTAKIIREKGLGQTGTYADLSQAPYEVVDVNGIKIGILNYNYTFTSAKSSRSINGGTMSAEATSYINSYVKVDEEKFFGEVEKYIGEMRGVGTDIIMCISTGVRSIKLPREWSSKMLVRSSAIWA